MASGCSLTFSRLVADFQSVTGKGVTGHSVSVVRRAAQPDAGQRGDDVQLRVGHRERPAPEARPPVVPLRRALHERRLDAERRIGPGNRLVRILLESRQRSHRVDRLRDDDGLIVDHIRVEQLIALDPQHVGP